MLSTEKAERAAQLLSFYNTNRQSQARLTEEAQEWEGRMERNQCPGGVIWRKQEEKAKRARGGAAYAYERAVQFRQELYELTGITVTF